jgi:hypothetical protein
VWTAAGDAQSLADAVAGLAARPERLVALGEAAAQSSQRYFSAAIVREQLRVVLDSLPALCIGCRSASHARPEEEP